MGALERGGDDSLDECSNERLQPALFMGGGADVGGVGSAIEEMLGAKFRPRWRDRSVVKVDFELGILSVVRLRHRSHGRRQHTRIGVCGKELSEAELLAERAGPARRYLESRGLEIGDAGLGLGVAPPKGYALRALDAAGFAEPDIAAVGLLADRRWAGRVVGAWRTANGGIGTLWARTPDHFAESDAKYLYLRGAPRTGLPPYGFGDLRSE